MEDAQPTAETLRRARIFWEQARDDLKMAAKMLRSGAALDSSYLSAQAASNALSAVCCLHGRFQLPAHSPARMAALCAELDSRFAVLGDACGGLEEAQQHSPFAPPEASAAAALAKKALEYSERVCEEVRAYLRENRARFFAP